MYQHKLFDTTPYEPKPTDYPDKPDHHYVSFSAGKDSVGTYLALIESGVKPDDITLIFCDTGDELPCTYDYLRYFHDEIHPVVRIGNRIKHVTDSGIRYFECVDVPLAWSRSELKRSTLHLVWDEILWRHESNPSVPPYPNGVARHCTRTLKVNAFQRYVRDCVPFDQRHKNIVALGIRRGESHNRSSRQMYADDWKNGWWEYCPIVDYSIRDLWMIHRKYNVKISPTYTIVPRSNCAGCAFAGAKQIQSIARVYGAELFAEWLEMEEITGKTIFEDVPLNQILDGATSKIITLPGGCNSGYCES